MLFVTGLKGVPPDLWWPAQKIRKHEKRMIIYINSDNAHVKDYAKKRNDGQDLEEITGELSDLDTYLLKTQELIVIRGKRGRPVPVIVPKDASQVLQYLASSLVRDKAGILESNSYLFANTRNRYLRAYDSLKMMCDECQLKAPERITSVNLRKYTATLTQVMNLEGYQLEWLCSHLGHKRKVHLEHYRQMSDFVERVQISKLLLVQDLGVSSKFAGKKLEEIDLKDIISEEQVTDTNQDVSIDVDEVELINDSPPDSGSGSEEEEKTAAKRAKNVATRVPWTRDEEEELQRYLSSFFLTRKTPGTKDCKRAIEASKRNGGLLQRRLWPTIVKKVSNMNKKSKSKFK